MSGTGNGSGVAPGAGSGNGGRRLFGVGAGEVGGSGGSGGGGGGGGGGASSSFDTNGSLKKSFQQGFHHSGIADGGAVGSSPPLVSARYPPLEHLQNPPQPDPKVGAVYTPSCTIKVNTTLADATARARAVVP